MVSANDFKLNEVFGRAKRVIYEIPKYQRGYAWEKKQVDEFWEDLNNASNSQRTHFFGSFFTTKDPADAGKIRVVDGQQRLTTSAIFLICVRDFFYMHSDTNQLAKENLKTIETWLYMIDETTHEPDPNRFYLTLSRTNRDFFVEKISIKNTFDAKNSIRDNASNDSNELLADAYLNLSNLISLTCTPDDDGMRKLNDLAYTLIDQFELIRVDVGDEVDAYLMFNLINNRGEDLGNSDLIKNILFAKLDEIFRTYPDREERLDNFDSKWAEIRDNITGQSLSNYKLDNYFHHYLIAFEFKNLQHKQIFKKIVELLENKNADDIIINLQTWSRYFVDIRNPKEKFDRHPRIEHYLTKIKNIDATYVYPVILAGYKNYWQEDKKKEFEKLVEICFKFHIRVKSLGVGVVLSNYQQKLYDIADRINSGETINQIIDILIQDESTYPSEEKLKLQLKTLKIQKGPLAVSLLEELENKENPQYVSPVNVSAEHIMPRKINEWKDYLANKHDLVEPSQINDLHGKYLNYLGNQTLLSDPTNIKNSNKPFDTKKQGYGKEGFQITRIIAEQPDWTIKQITDRQNDMVNSFLEILDLEKCKMD